MIWKTVKRVAARAGAQSHVHALRVAFAVQFDDANPDKAIALKELMGHSRIDQTVAYLRRKDKAKAIESSATFPGVAQVPSCLRRERERQGKSPGCGICVARPRRTRMRWPLSAYALATDHKGGTMALGYVLVESMRSGTRSKGCHSRCSGSNATRCATRRPTSRLSGRPSSSSFPRRRRDDWQMRSQTCSTSTRLVLPLQR